jgi:hypothetical protein
LKLAGLTGESLEIAGAKSPSGDGRVDRDHLLIVAVQFHGFAGQTDPWVLDEAWRAFLEDLAELERARQGAASLEATSPEELRLSFRSTDSAGHMAVEGFVGVRSGSYAAKLTFSPMAFDPTELPRVLRELKALAP